MIKRRADIVNADGAVIAKFNETCREFGGAVATVRLSSVFTLSGTESLALYAQGIDAAVVGVAASDPAGTEIREFHGTSAVGCVPDGTKVSLVKSPGGDLGTLLIVLGTGTVKRHEH
jgi:hypothetical protein